MYDAMPGSMRILVCLFTLASGLFAAASADVASLVKRVGQNYRQLKAYRIESDTKILVTKNGQTGTLARQTILVVGNEGEFLVREDDGNVVQLRVSDGKTTWKALPRQKVWSKAETSQSILNDDDAESEPSANMGQDLFTQTRSSFVGRYVGIDRYAMAAQFKKEARLKWNGEKTDCVMLHLATGDTDSHLFIAKDSGWIVRHVESVKSKTGEHYEITTDYKRVDRTPPVPGTFKFAEASSGKQVAEVSLPNEHNASLVGQRAADFTLNDLSGARVHLAELQGKPVLLDFWATWCPPCRRELPTIVALSHKYEGKVAVYGINSEDAKTTRRYLEEHNPGLLTLHDDKSKVSRMYGCSSIPTVVVLDKSGKVVAHFVGQREERDLIAALKQAGAE